MNGSVFSLIGVSITVPGSVLSLMVTYTFALHSCDVGLCWLFSRSARVLNTKSASNWRLNCGPAGRNVSKRYVGAWMICLVGAW